MIQSPVSVYINWSAYDELSDNVELTEALALGQLTQLLRWRGLGARLDYYMVDAFWYARSGGFREFRKPHWPQGPDRFLDLCLENNILPGLWLPTNNQGAHTQLDVHPAWKDSFDSIRKSMCLFSGGYLPHLLETMDLWYQRGVRAFKFDFANFAAVPPSLEPNMLPSEIRFLNESALQAGLKRFRVEHPQVLLLGYNGFEEADTFLRTDAPIRRTIDPAWLETFDSLYCGDPRPADVPAMNFWRSKDIYSDHMVRYFEAIGFPLERIDNAGFMIGTTGTCYYRGAEAWKGMLLLSLARGGWVNTYYGNLELLDDEAVTWFARAQTLFSPLQQFGKTSTFGSMPGSGHGYGFMLCNENGAVAAVVNPSQSVETIHFQCQTAGRILFHDAGFVPVLDGSGVKLGPEQMCLVGFGCFTDQAWDFGVMQDVRIPHSIQSLDVQLEAAGHNTLRALVPNPTGGLLRVVMQQFEPGGLARRSSRGAPPGGQSLENVLVIRASQNGQVLPVKIRYDKAIWSGLSWAVGEIQAGSNPSNLAVEIECISREEEPVTLKAALYRLEYS